MFLSCSRIGGSLALMTDEPLRPADPDAIRDALAFALRYDGRRRVTTGDEFMAKITAERLVRHLELSGFVVMRGPPRQGHSTSGGRTGGR